MNLSGDDVVHWYQQLDFALEEVQDELVKLSCVDGSSIYSQDDDVTVGTRLELNKFQKSYPLFFGALSAAFH